MGWPWPALGRGTTGKKKLLIRCPVLPEDGAGVSARNVGKSTHPDAAVRSKNSLSYGVGDRARLMVTMINY